MTDSHRKMITELQEYEPADDAAVRMSVCELNFLGDIGQWWGDLSAPQVNTLTDIWAKIFGP